MDTVCRWRVEVEDHHHVAVDPVDPLRAQPVGRVLDLEGAAVGGADHQDVLGAGLGPGGRDVGEAPHVDAVDLVVEVPGVPGRRLRPTTDDQAPSMPRTHRAFRCRRPWRWRWPTLRISSPSACRPDSSKVPVDADRRVRPVRRVPASARGIVAPGDGSGGGSPSPPGTGSGSAAAGLENSEKGPSGCSPGPLPVMARDGSKGPSAPGGGRLVTRTEASAPPPAAEAVTGASRRTPATGTLRCLEPQFRGAEAQGVVPVPHGPGRPVVGDPARGGLVPAVTAGHPGRPGHQPLGALVVATVGLRGHARPAGARSRSGGRRLDGQGLEHQIELALDHEEDRVVPEVGVGTVEQIAVGEPGDRRAPGRRGPRPPTAAARVRPPSPVTGMWDRKSVVEKPVPKIRTSAGRRVPSAVTTASASSVVDGPSTTSTSAA